MRTDDDCQRTVVLGPWMPAASPARVGVMTEKQNLQGRRWLLGITLMAAEQASRVLEVCASVEGDDAALNRALCEEFDISSIDAEVVLSLQVRRFTPASIARMRSELAEMERRIALVGEQ